METKTFLKGIEAWKLLVVHLSSRNMVNEWNFDGGKVYVRLLYTSYRHPGGHFELAVWPFLAPVQNKVYDDDQLNWQICVLTGTVICSFLKV